MKLFLLLLLMSWHIWCRETIVIKISKNQLEKNEKTYLSLENSIRISFPLTICTRFKLKGQLSTSRPIFSLKEGKLLFLLRFAVGTGSFQMNDESLVFEIPKENDIQPYEWHHICIRAGSRSKSWNWWKRSYLKFQKCAFSTIFRKTAHFSNSQMVET